MVEIILRYIKCQRCGHAWVPRKTDIRQCPKCKSAYWEIPRKSDRTLTPTGVTGAPPMIRDDLTGDMVPLETGKGAGHGRK